MNLKVKGNQMLFDRFLRLQNQMIVCAGIVQNDMEITEEQLQEFHDEMGEISADIEDLESSVGFWINKCNPKTNDN